MTPQKEFLVAFRLLLSNNIDKVYVLPFTRLDNKFYILMGKQRKTNKLISFETKNLTSQNFFEEVSKNFNHDTVEIFSVDREQLKLSPALVFENKAVIFVKVDSKHKKSAREDFSKANTSGIENQNISDILWVSFGNFEKLILGEKIGMSKSIKTILEEVDFGVIKSALSAKVGE